MRSPVAEEGSFGRYRLIEPIGAGGMAVVYRAIGEAPGGGERELVIKRVLPELSRDAQFARMLVAEARLSARLHHPAIVEVYELGRVGDEFYLAMERVDGVDLVRLLNRCVQLGRALPVGLACLIASQVASALAYAHDLADERGRPLDIVHRDISPSNIMVTRTGGVKLLDFGVAKAAEHARDERTRTGTLKGKIHYLSPEQAEGLPVDRRSDLFSLGVVLHESLCMRRLFRGDSDLVTLRMVREARVESPAKYRPELDGALEALVLRMLAREPAARFQSCGEVARDLAAAAERLGADAQALSHFYAELEPYEARATASLEPAPPVSEDAETHAVQLELDDGPTPRPLPPSEQETTMHPLPAPPSVARAPSRSRARPWPRALRARRAQLVAGGGAIAIIALFAIAIGLLRARSPKPAPLAPAATEKSAEKSPAENSAKPTAPAPEKNPANEASAQRAPGTLVLDVNVAAARIELDGAVVADQVHSTRLTGLAAGDHALTVTALRRRPYQRTVAVPPGGSLFISVRLERVHASDHDHARTAAPPRGENYLFDPFGKKK